MKNKNIQNIKLSDLIENFDANSFILIDAGQGSGGTDIIKWDSDTKKEYGNIEMYQVDINSNAYAPNTDIDDTFADLSQYCFDTDPVDEMWTSDWIVDDDTVDNPYQYRIIF